MNIAQPLELEPAGGRCINPRCALELGPFASMGFYWPARALFCARCAALLVWCAPRKGRAS